MARGLERVLGERSTILGGLGVALANPRFRLKKAFWLKKPGLKSPFLGQKAARSDLGASNNLEALLPSPFFREKCPYGTLRGAEDSRIHTNFFVKKSLGTEEPYDGARSDAGGPVGTLSRTVLI